MHSVGGGCAAVQNSFSIFRAKLHPNFIVGIGIARQSGLQTMVTFENDSIKSTLARVDSMESGKLSKSHRCLETRKRKPPSKTMATQYRSILNIPVHFLTSCERDVCAVWAISQLRAQRLYRSMELQKKTNTNDFQCTKKRICWGLFSTSLP